MSADKGLFIVFEGGDGSGKSTQMALIADFLAARGFDIVRTREPGGTEIGEKIRKILLDPANGEMQDVAEMLLYAAARAQLTRELVLPALEAGKVVLCDRWVLSSLVYQGEVRGLGGAVAEVNEFATGGLEPDLLILLDIDPEVGLARAGRDGVDRLEGEGVAWHRRVREAYLEHAKNMKNAVVVDASGRAEQIHAVIIAEVEKVLGQ